MALLGRTFSGLDDSAFSWFGDQAPEQDKLTKQMLAKYFKGL
jgi:hypothetical protein